MHEFLYSLRDKKKEKAEQASIELEKCRDWRPSTPSSFKTGEYYINLKHRSFQRYFALLDHDSDGRISLHCCNLSAISSEVSKILRPVLAAAGKKGLTEEEFCKRADECVKKLSPVEKAALLGLEKEVKEDGKVRRKQPCSSVAVRPQSRLSDPSDIYTRSQDARQRAAAKVQSELLSQAHALAQLCPFRPFTLKGRASKKYLH